MSPEQHEQIRKILEFKAATGKRTFEDQRKAIYARNAADGCLKSGGTIRQIIRALEEVGSTFIGESIEQVSLITQDIDAFAALQFGFDDFWSHLGHELQATTKLAGGKSVNDNGTDSISRSAQQLFERSGSLLRQRLELYRFTFTKPAPGDLPPAEIKSMPTAAQTAEFMRRAKGGRPLAEHWDDMWAAVAAALYEGDLNPKSQAEIEAVMLTWLENHGFSAATSTVRGRARRLWDRLQDEN